MQIDFNAPYQQQVDFFKKKLNLPTRTWRDLMRGAHDHAFVVAGAQAADLIADLRESVRQAIDEGLTLSSFRAQFDETVARYGWEYNGGRNWRTKVIYLTNLRTSHAAGRYQQLSSPAALAARPYWRYVHSDDVLQPRPLHESWDNLILPADDPWWDTHYPPNDWGCQCRVFSVAKDELPDFNKTQPDSAPDDGSYTHTDPDGNTTDLPSGVGYGWDYAPGQSRNQSAHFKNDKLARLANRDIDVAKVFKRLYG